MKFFNVEASAFRKGEYVGYARGVWRIRRVREGWRAEQPGQPAICKKTLAAISVRLGELENSPADHADPVVLFGHYC